MSTNAAIRSGRPLPFDIDCLEQNYHYAFGTLNLVPITPLQARYQKKSRSFRWCEGIMTFPNGSEMLHCWLEVRVGGKLRTVDFSDTARFYLGAVEFEAAKHQEALNLSHIHYLEGAVVRKRLLTTLRRDPHSPTNYLTAAPEHMTNPYRHYRGEAHRLLQGLGALPLFAQGAVRALRCLYLRARLNGDLYGRLLPWAR